ncbi:MAG: preprotein translocase subunit SecE [Anaerolineae bacterium]
MAKAKASTPARQDNLVVRYFKESIAEMRKVTWPTRREAWHLTLIVLGATITMAVFLGALAAIFQEVLSGILIGSWVWGIVAVIVTVACAAIFVLNSRSD